MKILHADSTKTFGMMRHAETFLTYYLALKCLKRAIMQTVLTQSWMLAFCPVALHAQRNRSQIIAGKIAKGVRNKVTGEIIDQVSKRYK